MNDKSKLTIKLSSSRSSKDIKIIVSVDGWPHYSTAAGPTVIDYDFVDHGGHVIEVQMDGKTDQHTKIDSNGNLLEDILVSIDQVLLNDVDITKIFTRQSKYTHDQNGHGNLKDHDFYGTMGCNGTVKFEFASPSQMWILQNI